jgi:hypothetical protein
MELSALVPSSTNSPRLTLHNGRQPELGNLRGAADSDDSGIRRAESAGRHREASHRQSRCGAGRQAHRLDERHQDLIHDLGEQLIGSR